MSDEGEHTRKLVRSKSAALTRLGPTPLISRGIEALIVAEEADEWLRKGLAFRSEKRYEDAQLCFEKGLAIDPNHMSLLVECAAIHMDSDLEPRNYSVAVAYFTRAAELGHSTAQLWLGYMYEAGEGVDRDIEHALYWLLKSTAQKNPDEAGHWTPGTAQSSLKNLYAENPKLQTDRERIEARASDEETPPHPTSVAEPRNLVPDLRGTSIPDSALPGLDSEESIKVVCAHLFEPRLIGQFMSYEDARAWCREFVQAVVQGRSAMAASLYRTMECDVILNLKDSPVPSLLNPPFSIASRDGIVPSLPWRTPGHEDTLISIVSGRSSSVTPFGELLQIAFIMAGGPGDSVSTAFRVRAPTQTVRAFAEHWMMRLYKASYVAGIHFSLAPDSDGRLFSKHNLKSPNGHQESIFFETTQSLSREYLDFTEFLSEYEDAARVRITPAPQKHSTTQSPNSSQLSTKRTQ
ncbi:MAG: tetratricopeptide repeat protein [Edaphobacter sp.]